MNEILSWSAVETAKRVAARDVAVVEVTDVHLSHAEQVNGDLNALPALNGDEARDFAKSMDASRPDELLPAYGVPMTSKINVDQAGFVNSNGLPALAGQLCDRDSAVVANMKAGGGVLIARTNTPEFSMRWCTSNPLHGVTLNPWDKSKTPGGSSGGAAASIAAGVGCIAHGNDLGGSLRYPAFCCGVVSIRPSMGRVPAFNPCAQAERPPLTQTLSVQGPIARNVADVRLGLEVMAARDTRDPLWVSTPKSQKTAEGPLKIGFNADPFGDGVENSIARAVENAIKAAGDIGAEVVEIDPPHMSRVAEVWGELLFSEGRVTIEAMVRKLATPEMNRVLDGFVDAFKQNDLAGVMGLMMERIALQRAWAQMFEDIDVLVLPVSSQAQFDNDLDFTSPEKIPEMIMAQRALCAINLLALPSVALPTHIENGLPSGVQIVAPIHEDFFALDVAEKLEKVLGRIGETLVQL